ncbi:MAG: type II toxin-antitoxin system PemK/MazF family toxin [Acidobacteria bacterium]|nr:type II toxin-antitoxin system PemK/MazF family toxin [Acidobacteriota bacterium]
MAGSLSGRPRRGEIWHYRFGSPDKMRPVLILTRQRVLPLLRTAMVAPITSTIRGLPSEVVVGVDEGLKHDSAVNLDHVQTVEQRLLHRYAGSLSEAKMHRVCRALALATGCA